LAQEISQYFRLVCLGVDVMAKDISKSWKEGDFGIIEINAAPGVSMHLNPAVGESVNVPHYILEYLFPREQPCRLPIITFNRLKRENVYHIIDHILLKHPHWTMGTVCRDGVWLNRSQKNSHQDYNSNVQSLLRHPKLDLLIAEYPEEIFEGDGTFYEGSNLIILDDPSETELILTRDLLPKGTIIIKRGNEISVQAKGQIESYRLAEGESFSYVYLKEINRLLLEVAL
jgi:cyanophycin synthetase